MIEIVVGVLVLMLGVTAALAALPASSRQTQTAQLHEQGSAVAERELEAIRRMSWTNLGLTAYPIASGTGLTADEGQPTNPRNPNHYVNGTAYRIKEDWHDSGSAALAGTPAAGEPLVVTGVNGIAPSATFNVGGTTGTVYRFVTGRNELCAPQLPTNLLNSVVNALAGLLQQVLTPINNVLGTRINAFCAGPGPDAKRVTVAVVLDRKNNKAAPTRPIYMTTLVTDPARGLLN
jgi:type II secretory pathway pseudopilin PulG